MSNFKSNAIDYYYDLGNLQTVIDLSNLNNIGYSLQEGVGIEVVPYLNSNIPSFEDDDPYLWATYDVDWYANNQYVDSGIIDILIDTKGTYFYIDYWTGQVVANNTNPWEITGVYYEFGEYGEIEYDFYKGITFNEILNLTPEALLDKLDAYIFNGATAIVGSGYGDILLGKGGNDIIEGNGGDDIIYGGPGKDTLGKTQGNSVGF